MNMDEKSAYIQEAIKMGGNVQIKFYDINGKENAMKVAKHFSELLSIAYKENEHTGTFWLDIRDLSRGIDIAIFYELTKEELKFELLKQVEDLKGNKEALA